MESNGDLLNGEGSHKRRKLENGHGSPSARFKPGNILKLRIRNFTTYSYGEFILSPTLNMIIGPNGTGKSTFVAAVCLGLGGKVDLIKRKNMDSMIKSGSTEASIEITLKNKDDLPDLKIKRTFFLKNNKSKWLVNGASSDVVKVRQIVVDLGIQLDNLCHFLPQERVAEFATLSPEKLLLETERTIGDNTLLDKHELLIELDNQWVDLNVDVERLETNIEGLIADVAKFEQEAQRYAEFEEKAKQIDHHKKLLPFAKLQDVKEQMKGLKKTRDEAKKALQQFASTTEPLLSEKEGAEKAYDSHKSIVAKHRATVVEINDTIKRIGRNIEKLAQSIEDTKGDIDALQNSTEKRKKELQRAREEKDNLQNKLMTLEDVDEDAITALSSQRQDKHDEKLRKDEEVENIVFEVSALKREHESNEIRMREEKRKLDNDDKLEVLNTKGSRYRVDLLENTYKAHLLLRKERRNHGLKFYEAPVVSCHVTNPRVAKCFEKVVDNNSLFALYFDSEEDYQKVSQVLPRELNVPMRVASNEDTPPSPLPVSVLHKYGFDGYLSDFVDGPKTVVKALKHRSQLHAIPVATKPINADVIKRLLEPDSSGRIPFMRFIVENNIYSVGRSKYGSRQVFYRTEHIGEAQLMGAKGLTEEMKREIKRKMMACKQKMDEALEKKDAVSKRKSRHQEALLQISDELTTLDSSIRALRKKRETVLRTQENIKHLETRIAQLKQSMTQDDTAKIKQAEDKLMQLYIDHSGELYKLAEANENVVIENSELKKAELLSQQSKSKILTVQSLLEELDHRKVDLQERYADAKRRYDQYKKGDAAKEIKEQQLTDEEREIVRGLAEQYLNNSQLSEHYILIKIDQLEDELSLLSNADKGSIESLKTKRADLEISQRQLPESKRKRDDLKQRMDNVSIPWQEELSNMVETMSKVFQKNFITVASDGQVRLVKSERFQDWKLEILVKFRENSELKVLDHQSQSGGERAVSTIFFIMSLQGLTNAPIRIVDEINQGMDPKNEKMAHKYLVHTACKTSRSQHFLVTPKLLTGLYYHEDMAVHCIFTGPFLKSNEQSSRKPGLLDFQRTSLVSS
ncbi:hypothetical protein FT663_03525 [Candidozyma haemuli var. vulneris]|uniref:Structural maintenance of chromosomes protein 5 n=1 Tax=Candidozyma haemuli TaxID=45357 RepID=A0A2V1ATI8_9ASCO|nr:hypothetical protein CXQ85_000377 [[Candida] haemuloni]KAF3988211.1 hypothetical protein FT662_03557 [[Candida] haemuloni var. vulneris]KAF3989669.1 hypothetical protein FT663_03525 [[Candida] haemuloni var. vulneris]PVH21400.1 hypothetical protein CXQ85_000377 [[Candida] haemuloni]